MNAQRNKYIHCHIPLVTFRLRRRESSNGMNASVEQASLPDLRRGRLAATYIKQYASLEGRGWVMVNKDGSLHSSNDNNRNQRTGPNHCSASGRDKACRL